MRSSPPPEPVTVAPSAKAPRSTRASDNLPPCAVWIVRTHLGERRPLRLDAEPLARLRDAGRLVAQRLQQPRHPVAAGRRADQQRHDLAGAQFVREVVEHDVARRLDVAEQLLHQLVVVIGEALEHAIARLLLVAARRRPAFRSLPRAPPRGRRTRARAPDRRSRWRRRSRRAESGAAAAACAKPAAAVPAPRARRRRRDRSC